LIYFRIKDRAKIPVVFAWLDAKGLKYKNYITGFALYPGDETSAIQIKLGPLGELVTQEL